MIKLYGLGHCDTTKKAMKWLKEKGVEYHLHDYKLEGVSGEALEKWLMHVPQEKLLNKKSTTWRALDASEQGQADSPSGAVQLMVNHSSLIKRPLVEWQNGAVTVGFDEKAFLAQIQK